MNVVAASHYAELAGASNRAEVVGDRAEAVELGDNTAASGFDAEVGKIVTGSGQRAQGCDTRIEVLDHQLEVILNYVDHLHLHCQFPAGMLNPYIIILEAQSGEPL
ncbi:uncharacterized protein IL334_007973 [Kwoniella shivajii]|uniref:Uncharacterized protein n=1 Tax=Kwoniella shivajii TaxID=564305 RepID=A0ABZ1DA67_9TREE|nr:hypothetical protein IL334_007973 [Kwoniella shivajii]